MRLLTGILGPRGDSQMKMSGMLFISPRGIQIRDSGVTLFVHDETPLFFAFKVSLRVQPKKQEYLINALISVFRLDFCRSLENGLLARSPVLNRGSLFRFK